MLPVSLDCPFSLPLRYSLTTGQINVREYEGEMKKDNPEKLAT
jgi:hypothetical protein